MYGKLVDGVLQTPPVEISRNIKQMKDAGYKPVIDNNIWSPSDHPQGWEEVNEVK